jgi:DNA-binding response OmpR family regulator
MVDIILIVDDAVQCASTLEIALETIPGIEVAQLTDGEEALSFLRGPKGIRVAALVTDLNMPCMDGFELIRRVRSGDGPARLPIVVLSGDTDPRTPSRLRQLGADAYFAKPFSPSEVRTRLEQLIDVCQT